MLNSVNESKTVLVLVLSFVWPGKKASPKGRKPFLAENITGSLVLGRTLHLALGEADTPYWPSVLMVRGG